jgi:RNA polymerase sigma factor (sigma-70 family)
MSTDETRAGGDQRAFPETVGGLIGRLTSAESSESALEELCRAYWKPVYHWMRVRWSKSNDDAKDLTQAFFLWALENQPFDRYDPGRGTFRAFLKSLLTHFVQHQQEALGRLKRGGGLKFFPVDDQKDRLAGPEETDPGRAFDAAWRSDLIERAVATVRRTCRETGREIRIRVFEAVDLEPPDRRPTYKDVAERLGLRETDVHNHLVRVHADLREAIRAELARRSSSPGEIDEEFREFFQTS